MVKDNSVNTEFLTVHKITLFNITMNMETTPHEFHKEQRSRKTGGFAGLLPVVGQDAPPISARRWADPPHAQATSQNLFSHRLATANTVRRHPPSLYATKTHSHLGFRPHAAGLTNHHRGRDTLLLQAPHQESERSFPAMKEMHF